MKFSNDHSMFKVIFCLQFILFLTGCKIIDWGKENFKQADRYGSSLIKQIKPYLKSTIVYNQLSTIATFDALFLTDQVRMLYVDYYTKRHLISHEKESVMRQRLLNENKYYISFYIVGSQAESYYPSAYAMFTGEYHKPGPLFGEKDAEWQIRMKVGKNEYAPDSIRVVELPTEYQHFFGAQYSQFKSVYLVKFDTVDHQDREIFSKGIYDVTLEFTSPRYKSNIKWKDIAYFD